MDDNYSKRELDSKFTMVSESIREIDVKRDQQHNDNKARLDELLWQARKTNGRVSALEKWQWTLAGGLAVITVIVIPLLFLFLKGQM